jgi:hypothetical protein
MKFALVERNTPSRSTLNPPKQNRTEPTSKVEKFIARKWAEAEKLPPLFSED